MFPITVIGSYPKPEYLKVPNWFDGVANGKNKVSAFSSKSFSNYINKVSPIERENNIYKATREILIEQNKIGIDIPTDGELYRENYVYFQCRNMNGFDFSKLKKLSMRNGQYIAYVPRIVSPITPIKNNTILVSQWLRAQSIYNEINGMNNILNENNFRQVKMTIAGPMTVLDTICNDYYKDEKQLLWDLSCAINIEILKLISNGAKYIQIDEPLFSRKPELARDFGFKCLKRCLKDVNCGINNNISGINSSNANNNNNKVITFLHICCGYTDELDDNHYKKAENNNYVKLAKYGLNKLNFINYISIEDGHRRIPLIFFNLMNKYNYSSGIVLGCIKVCKKEIYTTNEIISRVCEIIDKTGFNINKLMLAPDCGLGMLPRNIVIKKLNVLNESRNILRQIYDNKSTLSLSKSSSYQLYSKL